MPRPAANKLAPRESVDLSPAREIRSGSIMASLGTIVHWSDSHEVRRAFMDAVQFPIDDMASFLVVNYLAYRGALRPTEVAKVLDTGRSNVTKIVARLETLGLVTRTPDPDDERGVLVALTAPGRAVGERIVDHAEARIRESVGEWSIADREALEMLLSRLAAGAESDGYRARPHG